MPPFEQEISSSLYGCESASTLPVYLSDKKGPHVMIVSENQFDSLKQIFLFFKPQQRIFQLPSLDPWFPNRSTLIERTKWLSSAFNCASDDIFLCSYQSLSQKTLPLKVFQKYFLNLSPNSMCPTPQTLKKYGYFENFPLEEPGCFFQKGGILDIFTPLAPIRIQTLGDQIESIHFFDPKTQANLSFCPSITLTPLYEASLFSDQKVEVIKRLKKLSFIPQTFLKKLAQDTFFSEKALLLPFFHDSCEQALQFFKNPPKVWCMENQTHQNDFLKELNETDPSFLNRLIQQFYFKKIHFPQETTLLKPLIQENKNVFPVQKLKNLKKLPSVDFFKNHFSVLTAVSENLLKYMEFKLKQMELEPCLIQNERRDWSDWKFEQLQNPKKVHLILGNLPENFKTKDSVFLKGDLFFKQELPKLQSSSQGRGSRLSSPSSIQSNQKMSLKLKALHFSEIQKGDLVVDKMHGTGCYRGLKTLHYGSSFGEYIELEYKDKNRLYIPISQIHRLYRFRTNLKTIDWKKLLDSLGNINWKQKIARAQSSIKNLVLEIFKTHSIRNKITRKPFSPQSANLEQFENDFPFEETRDQKQAIEDVFKDMRGFRPMNRLIIGDSGYGKTEVAMRASFKAVEDFYQVAFLAPTTILSLQHLNSFKTRFHKWPVRIELINRLVSSQKIKRILKDLQEGKVDILIGSHRLLSSDIQFKNLGLIIIDEEHRFGVKQKEKLKRLKLNVDCIYMSATPIPRTLSMGLSQAQDLSLVQTPPRNRIAPHVFVIHFEEAKIKQAIEREISRGGQVLFVHNRVQTLDRIYEKLSSLFPHLSIQKAHGQMNEQELEKNILHFFQHKSDLLVCTTIVESGMDFSKVNTILINNAHLLGLSQLYQLKGRVGRRSSVQPYCYFILPEEMPQDSSAVERINFLQTHSHLSSGYQIARYDLEMRGGGEFLGAKQSGHITDVGYDLFLEMFENELNPSSVFSFECELKLPFDAYIPSDYIPHDKIRLMYYRHLCSIDDVEEIQELEKELKDGFGDLPVEVKNLFGQVMIRHQAQKLKIKELKVLKNNLYLKYSSDSSSEKSEPSERSEKFELPESFSWIHIYDFLLSKQK